MPERQLMPPLSIPARRAAAVLAVASACALGLAVAAVVLHGINWRIGPVHLRVYDPWRPLIIGALLAATLLVLARERTLGCLRIVLAGTARLRSLPRGVAVVLLVLATVVGFGTYARLGHPFVQVGDHAVIEIYTIHSTHLRALLGPYSRFGWNHPGPVYFYLLAPFYMLSGGQPAGLFAGAVAINLAAFAAVAWVVFRLARGPSAVAILAACAFYVIRIGRSLPSSWNPHVLPLPTMALVVVCAAVAIGRVSMLPWAALIATFLVQTHVGMTPVVATAAAFALAGAVAPAFRSVGSEESRQARRTCHVTLWLLAGLWALPLAEQLVRVPGNLGQLLAFFVGEGHPGQPIGAAFATWSELILGVVHPAFEIPWSGGEAPSEVGWSGVAAVAQVALVGAATFRAARARRSFEAALGLLLVMASFVSLLAVMRVTGRLWPYVVFWTSGVGALNTGVVLGAGAEWLSARIPPVSRAAVAAVCVVLCGVAGVSALRHLQVAMAHGSRPSVDEVYAGRLWQALDAYRREQGLPKPLIDIDQRVWGMAAALAAQMQKAGVPYAVGDRWLPMFSDEAAATGNEGCVLAVAQRARRDELLRQPGYFLIAEAGSTFVLRGPAPPARAAAADRDQ